MPRSEAIICVILESSISHHNKSYDYESDNNYRQKPKKIRSKCAIRQCRGH